MSTKYKCNIQIINKTRSNFNRTSYPIDYGKYSKEPPKILHAGASANFCLEYDSNWKDMGPSGQLNYATTDEIHQLFFKYQCPYHTSAYDSLADGKVISGNGLTIQMTPNPVPGICEPLNVQFIISETHQ